MAAGVYRDLTGEQFGRYTVLQRAKSRNGVKWLCRCRCGRVKAILTGNLTTGESTQCRSCARSKHGDSRSHLYMIWRHRVSSPHGCCKAWRQFTPSKTWAVKNGWRPGLWIHRKRDIGPYRPENCFIGPPSERARMGRSPSAKLTPEDIPKIRQLAATGTKQQAIARMFNVSQSLISMIVTRKLWNSHNGQD